MALFTGYNRRPATSAVPKIGSTMPICFLTCGSWTNCKIQGHNGRSTGGPRAVANFLLPAAVTDWRGIAVTRQSDLFPAPQTYPVYIFYTSQLRLDARILKATQAIEDADKNDESYEMMSIVNHSSR